MERFSHLHFSLKDSQQVCRINTVCQLHINYKPELELSIVCKMLFLNVSFIAKSSVVSVKGPDCKKKKKRRAKRETKMIVLYNNKVGLQ